jgi:hypothetical protein
VSRLVDEILKSIIEEFAAPGMSKEDLEQKSALSPAELLPVSRSSLY